MAEHWKDIDLALIREASKIHPDFVRMEHHPSELLTHYESNLKFVLDDPESRTYSVYRMCYLGEGGWMFLDFGTLESLAKKTMPHLELESFMSWCDAATKWMEKARIVKGA